MDLDEDGEDELLSGSYPGEIYIWEKGSNGEYVERKVITLSDGTPIRIGYAVTVFPGDVDGDGKIDLLISGLYDGLFWARNVGTRGNYRFDSVEKIHRDSEEQKQGVNHAVLYDWDKDGMSDIVLGVGYSADVRWIRNLGQGMFATSELLICRPDSIEMGVKPGQGHGDKPQICFYDYDKDGKDDLVLATDVWETPEKDFTPEMLQQAVADQRLIEPSKNLDNIVKKIRKYTDNVPLEVYSKPDNRIPKKLYEEWVKAYWEHDGVLQDILAELRGGRTKMSGMIWVYYKK